MNMKSICLIPARGGSKGIPQKNIKKLNDKPLIAHTIESALKSHRSLHQLVCSRKNCRMHIQYPMDSNS